MAIAGAFIGAALGLGAVGTAAVQLGLAVGLGYAAKSLKPSAKGKQRGQNVSLRIETDAPREVILGRQATAGSLVYWQCTGAHNKTLQMVIALADHECEGLVELWVDGKLRSWDPETGIVDGFDDKLVVRFYSGAADQTVDTVVRDASGGRWTDNERGIGVCYAVVEATEDEKVFKGGIPQILFVIDGAKLYDPRKDDTVGGEGDHRWGDASTYEFSDNSAVAIYNVLRGIYQGDVFLMGLLAPADTIRMSDFEAAANACDEAVSLAAGGTEPRYRCAVRVDVGPGLSPERDALEMLIEGMAGDVICAGGIYRIMAGVSRSPVASLTDADFVVTEPLIADPRRPRTELANAIAASFSDPGRSYNVVPLPTRRSSEDEAADGGYRWTRALDLSGVRSRTQGQRVQEIRRREARRQLRGRGTLKARWFVLEPGDWVEITSNRRGWEDRTFEIGASSVAEALASDRELIEVDGGIDDWSTSDEIADDAVADLPGGGPTLTEVGSFTVEVVTIEGVNGQQIPGLRATWTPIDDATVTSLRIQYRKLGDTEVLGEVAVLDPSAGQRTWAGGIQGGIEYQARAIPVTQPVRTVDWTAWASSGTETAQQIVGVAQLATSVPPDTITAEMLDEQSRRTLLLMTARAEAQGSVAALRAEVRDEILRLTEAVADLQAARAETGAFIRRQEIIRQSDTESFAQQLTQVQAQLENDVATAIQTLEASVFDEENGLPSKASASSVTALSTTVGDLTSTVGVVAGTVDGIKAYYGVTLDVNGRFGFFKMDGTGEEVSALFAADKFAIIGTGAEPDVKAPFYVDTEAGVILLDGDVYAPGSITGEHIAANSIETVHLVAQELIAAVVRSEDNEMVTDYENKTWRIDF